MLIILQIQSDMKICGRYKTTPSPPAANFSIWFVILSSHPASSAWLPHSRILFTLIPSYSRYIFLLYQDEKVT